MNDDDSGKQLPKPRSVPDVVAPTNRVNVAFPFSNIHIESRSKDFDELATLVGELLLIVERIEPTEEVRGLRERAQALIARLH